MPRYSPLPSVSLDPRNEAQLVQDASQIVYDASNQTLNDFSSGNPLAALLEGQAFAQGEFLFWANQLPQKILLEWIGPFLGAMRRLGTPASARLQISITPSDSSTLIPAGTGFTSGFNNTEGQAYSFLTDADLVIPAGETIGYVLGFSQFVGSQYNVPANTITVAPNVGIEGLEVTNPLPAIGGSDVETYDEVQERFFTLIRRRNPVSAQDWQDFFVDLYGVGTQTSVQPNRTTDAEYNYITDYLLPNGQVSFFVLGPGGVELTAEQIARGQNVINFSVPVQGQGHLYPITLSEVQYNITISLDANGSFGNNLQQTSLDFRDRLYQVLQPGNFFPVAFNPSVGDVNAAFYSTFAETTRFKDPVVETASAYNTPISLTPQAATYTQVYAFEPRENLLDVNDLVTVTVPLQKFYPVITAFTPLSSAKADQPIYGNLKLQKIKLLAPGQYFQGDVVFWSAEYSGDNQLHVVLENILFSTTDSIVEAFVLGQLSAAKSYSPWVEGNSYAQTSGGFFDPEIVQYDYASDEFVPTQYEIIPLDLRPGALVWRVTNDFTLDPATNDLIGATTGGLIDPVDVTPLNLVPGQSYVAGTWVQTPQIGSGPNPIIDPNYFYVDIEKGAVTKYAYVEKSFDYNLSNKTVSEYFDQLVSEGTLREIVVQVADDGLPIYLYKPRFPVGEYLEYRESAGSTPQYCIAANYFTPNSTDLQKLLDEGLVIELATSPVEQATLEDDILKGSVKTPVRMFTFFRGDRTFFRENTSVESYTATSSVTPLFDFAVYLQNGTFVKTGQYTPSELYNQEYIPFFNPANATFAEDTVVAQNGRDMYRVMRAFTPALTATNWSNLTVTNTARIQEYEGNLLRYVSEYTCDEDILSQLGRDISSVKLGVAQINLIPKSVGALTNAYPENKFVWESTASFADVPQLSWYQGTSYAYSPPDYSGGTLDL